jgi:hypothetical protein
MRSLMIAAALTLAACGPAAEKTAPETAPAAAEVVEITSPVAKVEDAGYPLFTVTFERPVGGPLVLTLNAEDADLGGVDTAGFVGKTAKVTYSVKPTPNLITLAAAPDGAQSSATVIVGVLDGAGAPTASDLPDRITVTDADGRAMVFEHYVTPDDVALNGKRVVATYETRAEDRILAMRLVQE